MNILQLISSAGRYGAENVVLDLTESLGEYGCDVTLGVFLNKHKPNTELVDVARQRGLKVEMIPCDGRFDRKTIQAIRECIRKRRIDLLHTHTYKADLYGYAAARKLEIPRVATIHIWSERNLALHFYGILDRMVLRRFDKAVGVSDEIAARLRDCGVAPSRVEKIGNGIDIELFQNTRPTLAEEIGKKDRVLVGMVSRLLPEKGVEYFVRAAKQVLDSYPQALFVLVGDGPHGPALKALSRELGIEDRMIFAGQRRDMPGIFASLDVFALPSLNEGMPLVILEAMASGLPVVATRIAGIPEVVLHQETGLLIEPGDTVALRDSILRLIADRELRMKLGVNGRERVRQYYTRNVAARNYLRLYEGLLQTKAMPSGLREEECVAVASSKSEGGTR